MSDLWQDEKPLYLKVYRQQSVDWIEGYCRRRRIEASTKITHAPLSGFEITIHDSEEVFNAVKKAFNNRHAKSRPD